MKSVLRKRGVIGLDVVRSVMILLLILGVTAIAIFTGLNAVSRGTGILPSVTLNNGSIVNITVTSVTEATSDIAEASDFPEVDFDLDTLIITNETGDLGYPCPSSGVGVPNFNSSACVYDNANFSVSAFTISIIDSNAIMNSSGINITSNFSYFIGNDATIITSNVTRGVTIFFGNIPTVLSILGIVVIILTVTLIFFAISRFSRREETI